MGLESNSSEALIFESPHFSDHFSKTVKSAF
jgi:hypothetical protein